MARRKKHTRTSSTPPPRSLSERHHRKMVEVDPMEKYRQHWRDMEAHIREKYKVELAAQAKRDLEEKQKRKRRDLRPVEDLRSRPRDFIHRHFKDIRGRIARTFSKPSFEVPFADLPSQVHTYFKDPKRVLVCIRRSVRQRVLFALRRVGKGKKVSRNHRFSEQSYLRCK